MSKKLERNVELISGWLPRLAENRNSSPLANDVFEAATYWVQLARWFDEGNTKIDFPARAREERLLLETLKTNSAKQQMDSREYAPIFDIVDDMLAEIA